MKRMWWWKFHVKECCLCGLDVTWKERIYEDIEPKPDDISKQYVPEGTYACSDHFI